ncbi:MAG: hypothetical protein ACK5WM_05680 [Rhodospirillales bacterium]
MADGARSHANRAARRRGHVSPVRLTGVRQACARLACANENRLPLAERLRRLWPWALIVAVAVAFTALG